MVGNKSDLDAQRDVTYEEAKQFAEENGTGIAFVIIHHIEDLHCSALLFNNSVEMFFVRLAFKIFDAYETFIGIL